MSRRRLSVALVVAAALTLAACSSNGGGGGGTSTTGSGPTAPAQRTITFMGWGSDAEIATFKTMISQYEAK